MQEQRDTATPARPEWTKPVVTIIDLKQTMFGKCSSNDSFGPQARTGI